ncbi:hypothetical protein RB195_019162 [Necator americanus]|uniref:BAAT/acyl-CoA thioester hydrolase protein n=1 Tax=Necator americanus TaxID=51031 RepID=A0ABR1CGH0_NECAM
MGLFMSIEPCDDFPCGGYLSCTPPVPFIYNLILLDSCDCEITRIAIKKHWMHPALERTEIEADGFCGTLFKPPGEGPFPAVIDISGTGGGLHEHKGSMLASEGFVVLCVAFFQYKNLVKKLSDVEIEYFEKERENQWRELCLQGVSFGGTIAYRLASRYSQINAVVSINGPHVQNSFINIKEYGELLPQPRSLVWASTSLNDQSSVWTDPKLGYFINGLMVSSPVLRHIELDESVEIPWRRIPASTSFRLVASIDDLVAPSVFCCRYVSQRLIEGGHNFEVQLLNGGHIMEPPYFPHHDKVNAKFQGVFCGYGGDIVLHGKSQELSWVRTIEFFTRTLGKPANMPEWKRLQPECIRCNL